MPVWPPHEALRGMFGAAPLDPALAPVDWGRFPQANGAAAPDAAAIPEKIAAAATAAGVPPPAPTAPMQDPTAFNPGPSTGFGDVMEPRAAGPRVGAPMSLAPPNPGAATATPAAPAAKNPNMMESLRGVQAPKGPELQKLTTPAAPRPATAIQGTDFMQLLQMLNLGGSAPGVDRKLPSTLGAAIGR